MAAAGATGVGWTSGVAGAGTGTWVASAVFSASSLAWFASRIRRALAYRKPEDIIVAPDCGLKYLPRDSAFGKMKAMVEGALIVRAELGAN